MPFEEAKVVDTRQQQSSPILYVVTGAPAAGKTTYGRQLAARPCSKLLMMERPLCLPGSAIPIKTTRNWEAAMLSTTTLNNQCDLIAMAFFRARIHERMGYSTNEHTHAALRAPLWGKNRVWLSQGPKVQRQENITKKLFLGANTTQCHTCHTQSC